MAEKRNFIAGIKNTRLRRASMIVVVPILLLPIVPSAVMATWSALCVGAYEFAEHMRWEFDSRPMKALKLGLKQMWSKDWNTDQ